jgi:hypothetical protein
MLNKIVEGRRKLISEDDDFNEEEISKLTDIITNLPDFKNEIYTNISELVDKINKINSFIRFDKLKNRDDSVDTIILKRDLKFLGDLTNDFEKTTKEITVLNNRLELTYDDIINTIKKYYEVKGLEDEILDDVDNVTDSEIEDEIEEIEETINKKIFKKFN